MQHLIETFVRTTCRSRNAGFLFMLLISSAFVGCQKQVDQPAVINNNTAVTPGPNDFHLSASVVTLLQGNAEKQAISFNWKATANAVYTVEAAVRGTQFAEPIEIASTSNNAVGVNVADFNGSMNKLIYGNNTAMVDFRLRTTIGKAVSYSDAVALQVTTYRNYISFDDSKIFRIPGNYQDWKLETAPQIVTTGDGQYEGYIYFPNTYPQMLMIKGSNWDPNKTYTYIGTDKFGFGGTVLSVFGGAGAYLFQANTNANTWSYTKINNWSLKGSAVQVANTPDLEMKAVEANLTWTVTANFVKGNFRIRANNSDALSFGQKSSDQPGVAGYSGSNIQITQPGNYTIKLELQSAGNYFYSVLRNS